ncbi:MAG: SprT family zinc-dependent metalloprotease [Bdellovibrionales bacterium]|jgi:predicted metal-dependent hydrolase|nr:SprT family zinc-dependent metalloprotease [Bdellovibrionales bacterium]
MASGGSQIHRIGAFDVLVERRVARPVFGRRRRSGLRLTVEQDGTLKVTAPLSAPLRLVEEFVLANHEWIADQRQKMSEYRLKNPPKSFAEGEPFRFFGREHRLVFESAAERMREGARVRAELIEDLLVVRGLSREEAGEREQVVRTAIARLYDAQARLHVPERVRVFSEKMGVRPSGLSFRCQKTRWGSCSSQGHISINWKVIFAPEEVIDYLIVHELAHLVHANHSERFWSLVAIHDPEHRSHRLWLRRHQNEVAWAHY